MEELNDSILNRLNPTAEMNRRTLLKRSMVLGLSVPAVATLLAACGDDDEDPTATTAPAADPTATTAPEEPTATEEEDDEEDEPTATTAAAEPTATEEDDEEDEPTATSEPEPSPTDEPEETEEPGIDTSIRITGPFDGEASRLDGAGASFPAVLYSRWFFEYNALTGVEVNYQSIGSGGGIRSISEDSVHFGATDGPMNEEQIAEGGGTIYHLPMALGAVVATYNIPNLGDEPLRFTGDLLSGIFLGTITAWNDPALVEVNPQLADISNPILVIHRADSSGTSFIFTDYLSAVNQEWSDTVGVGTSVNWPLGLGASGNEGVAGEVGQNPYSIGYVELIYALQNDLGVALIQNQDGNWIEPTTDAVTAAAAGVSETIQDDLAARIVDGPGPDTYPISGFTWILAREEQSDLPVAIALTRMLWWCLTDAQSFNDDLGYAQVPPSIAEKALALVAQIHVNGEPAFPGE